jgi:hypothetical protein
MMSFLKILPKIRVLRKAYLRKTTMISILF